MSLLKQERKKLGLTQAQMADAIGVAQSTVARLEKSQRTMTREHATSISRVTGISPVRFIFPEEEFRDEADLIEIMDALSRISRADRKVALDFLRPYVEAHKAP